MAPGDLTLIVALLFGFYAAWNIGANDVSNAMGTSVGSKALTLKQAIVVAAIFEFSGAVFFGSHVSETIQRGIVNPDTFASQPYVLVYGMLASLIATGIWLQLATYYGLPVSTTHAIVGAIVGFGAIVGGTQAVNWSEVTYIACSWIASPLMGAATSFIIFSLLRKHIFYSPNPLEATKKALPWIVALVISVLALITLYRVIAPEGNFFDKILWILPLALLSGILVHFYIKHFQAPFCPVKKDSKADPVLVNEVEKAKKHLLRVQHATRGDLNFRISDVIEELDSFNFHLQQNPHLEVRNTEFYWVEKFFGFLQITSACMMAFSHGSNDVANAIGPLAAIVAIIANGSVAFQATIPTWILLLGGTGIVIGLATWGWRVIETIGKKITELTPSRGFSAEFGAALTILLASRFGFPISTTHTLVGAVFGVGLAGGIGALNLRTIRDILISWIITIPAGAILSIACYYIITLVVNP